MLEEDKELAKLVFRSSQFILITFSILMIFRLVSGPMAQYGIYFIGGTVIVCLLTMLASHFRFQIRITAYLFIGSIMVLLLARSYIAGGTDSPALIVSIITPVAAIFLLGRRAGIIFAVIVGFFLILFIVLRQTGHEYPEIHLTQKKLEIIQTLVIVFVMASCTWIAWLYAKMNESLRNTLLEQTRRDHLTGIQNRRAFDFALEKEIKIARRQELQLTLFMVDLDHFKEFNDLYGHHEGDQCLIQVANIIQSCLRRPGDMVARYGGEEFAVILPDTSLPQAMQLAETMRHAVLGLAIEHKDSPIGVVSITQGISDLNFDVAGDISPEDLIKQADEALYAGKVAGRNQVCIYEYKDKES